MARSRAYLTARDLMVAAGHKSVWVVREDLARRYLFGAGIEIGALSQPLRVPPRVRVRYVDRMSTADLIRTDGPTLRSLGLDPASIPETDVVDDADRLATFADQSVDFVVANHVLEHLEDPIGALENLLRVIRVSGILFLTLPDARHTFDAGRSRTTVEHLVRDHRCGGEASRGQHYEEWARDIEGIGPGGVPQRVAQFAREDARHHFHVWELEGFLSLLAAAGLPGQLVHAQAYLKEFAVILRKSGNAAVEKRESPTSWENASTRAPRSPSRTR